jgi:hypothetical protein
MRQPAWFRGSGVPGRSPKSTSCPLRAPSGWRPGRPPAPKCPKCPSSPARLRPFMLARVVELRYLRRPSPPRRRRRRRGRLRVCSGAGRGRLASTSRFHQVDTLPRLDDTRRRAARRRATESPSPRRFREGVGSHPGGGLIVIRRRGRLRLAELVAVLFASAAGGDANQRATQY